MAGDKRYVEEVRALASKLAEAVPTKQNGTSDWMHQVGGLCDACESGRVRDALPPGEVGRLAYSVKWLRQNAVAGLRLTPEHIASVRHYLGKVVAALESASSADASEPQLVGDGDQQKSGVVAADRKFMEMAVEEMLLSRSEHVDKVDPLVGAVLVSADGEVLGRAHRGKLRDGDHAEFTLIERVLGDRSLEGASLYVTLEPCTKRHPPKKPCTQWVVKSRIGRVFIGMTDPNPDICGRGIQLLMNNNVEVALFNNDLATQIREANAEFIAYYEGAERESPEEPFEGPSRLECEVVERADLDDLSTNALQKYVDARQLALTVPSEELWRYMERAGYLGRTTGGQRAPTLGGVVLFAEQPADILPQCRVSMEAKKAGRTVTADFEGPLMAFRDHLDGFLRANMRHFVEIREMDRVTVGEYPIEAIREAAFNAVVHRDYQGGARVHIVLGETSMEIRSPGKLLKPLSLSRVRSFDAPPYSRNPHIAVAIHRMGWIEEKGSGLRRMRDCMLARQLRQPMFDLAEGYFVVKLLGEDQAWHNIRVEPSFLDGLEPVQRKIVQHLLHEREIATRDCVAKFEITDGTARSHLRRLRELGIIKAKGSGPKTRYVLAGT